MDSYVATQAAEVGGSYDAGLETMQHVLVADAIPLYDIELNADGAWREYNTENNHSDYGIPPDIYRYTNMIVQENGQSVIRHGMTTSTQLEQDFGSGAVPDPDADPAPYLTGIRDKAGRIVNFTNPRDAALTAWEFNQLTKPDTSDPNGEPVWRYSNEQVCQVTGYDDVTGDANAWQYPDGTSCEGPSVTRVTSRFYRDDEEIAWHSQSTDGYHAYAQIMGHIIPARTNALGQLEIVLQGMSVAPVVNEGFTDSNQGHSAEFHGYLAEPGIPRKDYWLRVMEDGFDLNPDRTDSYSGLHPPNI
jgi:hypothetical protein